MTSVAFNSLAYCRHLRRRRAVSRLTAAAAVALTAIALSARADDKVYAAGRVLSSKGDPIVGATVAVYDDKNRVVDHARTDSNGDYSIAINKNVAHLNRTDKGFFAEVVGGLTTIVGGAAAFVANPVRAGVNTVANSEASAVMDPVTKGGIVAGGVVVDRILFGLSPSARKLKPGEERKLPGVLVMKVMMPGKNDVVGLGRVYWLQQTLYEAGGKRDAVLQAWLDPVNLTEADSQTPSKIESDYLRFSRVRLAPSIAQVGDHVRITVTLPPPPTPPIFTVVVARNSRTGDKWQLQPVGDGKYEGEFVVDRRFPRDDQVISILAYGEQMNHPGRRKDAELAIERAGLWDPKHAFTYDPLLVVSRTRADVTLTVIDNGAKP